MATAPLTRTATGERSTRRGERAAAHPVNLALLRDIGRDRADAWLKGNFDKIGGESSVDLRETYP